MKRTPQTFRTPLAPRTEARSFMRSLLHERRYLWICFILPALLMWLIYICMQVYPFGKESVLVLDLNGQYVYFFEELRNILQGDGSLLYSFSRALGGEFMGIFAYYLSSPFSFIVALFPASMITEALLVMFLLKVGCCGFTFALYIDSTRKRAPLPTVIFSSMYALCAYAVVMQHNTMWIDNLIMLPLVMLGIENLIKFGRWKLFVISLALAIYSNFYIGFMMCIFAGVYFFYAFFSAEAGERNPLGEKKHFLKSFGRMAGFSALTVAICAAIILCTYYSLTFGKTEFSNPNYEFTQRFDWANLLSKFYFGSYDTVRPEGLPWLYTGMLSLILAPLYFFAPHIKVREKISSGILVAFFLISFNASTIDLIWHGFQKPNWLNYRYSFMLCFFLILFAYKAFERLPEIGYRKVAASSGVVVLIIVILQKFSEEMTNIDDLTTVWLSVIITAIYLCVLRASTMQGAELRKTAAIVLSILCSLELFCAGLLNVIALDRDVIFSSRTSYQSFLERVSPIVSKIQSEDDSFYRMEKTVHRKTNDPFALDMNGLSGSTSTLNRKTIDLLAKLGLSSKSHWTKYLGGTPVLDSLLGIKYLVCEKDDKYPLYEYLYSYDDDLQAYRNNYALPIAYGVDAAIEGFDINSKDYSTPFQRMNEMLRLMSSDTDGSDVFTSIPVQDMTTDNCTQSSVAEHYKFTPVNSEASSGVTFTLKIRDTNEVYCYFPSDYTRECNLYINGAKADTYYGNETYRVFSLGSFTPGETVTVRLELQKENLYIRENADYFCSVDPEAFTKYMSVLSESPFNITAYTESSFEGTINVAEGDEMIFTSIPYDEGWRVYIDGERAELTNLLDGLVGFRAVPGEHTLEMRYMPDCFVIGMSVSAAGVAVFAGLWVLEYQYRKRRIARGAAVYSALPDVTPDITEEDIQ